jgi:NADPH:quinone reductase-like Zn-dependent oxidoreductase
MRAYRFDALTGLDDLVLHREPMPAPQRGEVLIKVRAVSLNYRDIAPVLGRYVWGANPGLIPCSDASGEVVAVGDGVTAFSQGDRVISSFHPRWLGGRLPRGIVSETYGTGSDGWLAEFKVVSQEAIVPLPDGTSLDEGSTLPCAATTAWNALSGSAPMRAGQTVLTLGTGGVSIFALQLAKAVGSKVVATTSSAEKASRLKALGADHVVNYTEIEKWGRHIKEQITQGVGVDCVVEVGGPATINQSLDAVRWGGEVVLIGFLSSDNPGIDYFHLKSSGAVVRSIAVGDRSILEGLVDVWSGSGLRPIIDRVFPFADARGAFEHLKNGRHFGKIVITLPD